MTRAQTRAQISLYADRIIESYLSNESLIQIAEKLRRGEALTIGETIQRSQQIRRVFRNAEHSFYQHRTGTYDDEEFRGELQTFKLTLSTAEHREWWLRHKAEFSPAVQAELHELIGEASDNTHSAD